MNTNPTNSTLNMWLSVNDPKKDQEALQVFNGLRAMCNLPPRDIDFFLSEEAKSRGLQYTGNYFYGARRS